MGNSLQRMYPLLVGVVVLSLLAGCGGPSIALTGTITDAYTGKPVSAATLSLGGVTTTTDPNGTYTFSGWSQRDTLQVSANGYETLDIVLASQAQLARPEPPAVTLNASIRPNTLGGRLIDSDTDQPLAGALVKVTEAISTTTDADGRYMLSGVPERFTVTIAAPEHDAVVKDLERITSFDAELRSHVLTGTITDRYTGKPLADVLVKAGDVSTRTGPDGQYRLEHVPKDATVEISAPGYAMLSHPIEKMTPLDIALRPDVLKGALVDTSTGKPIQHATIIATTNLQSAAVAFTLLENSRDGHFTIEGVPEQGYLQVLAPGYRKATIELKSGSMPGAIELEPFVAKGLYVKTSVAAQGMEVMDQYFDLIDRTELNALVLDLKSDNMGDLGLIYYESQVPIIKELGTSVDLMDVRAILAEAKKRNIYTIARIHIFAHDNLLAETKPEWAAKDTRGCRPNENRRCNGPIFYADWDIAWLDPWNENVWDYNIGLAVEAAQLGFDEINFDYIRFPNDGKTEFMQLSKPANWREDPQPMYENIGRVLERAQRAVNGSGAFLSADVFGYAAWTPQANIGQNAAIMGRYVDYICPMVYPSHFVFGEMGFDDPAEHPYEIVAESMKRGGKMIGDSRARLRPWLQDFTLLWRPPIIEYGPKEIRAQIDAAESYSQYAGWLLWDSDNDYTEEALKPAR